MGIKKWLARRGNVGSTARWAALGYRSVRMAQPDLDLSAVMVQLTTARYRVQSDEAHKAAVLAGIKRGLPGLAHYVLLLLIEETALALTTSDDRNMFTDIIFEELEKNGVPFRDVFDSKKLC